MKKNFWVNEMVNFGSALSTSYFPGEDDLLTLTGGEVMQGSILPVTIPPRAHPRGFAIFFLLGGLVPTPGHAERDNSRPRGLLIDHKYVVLCSKLISVQ